MRPPNFIERIPDYLYLFPEHADGGTLFFKAAYDAKLASCQALFGIEGAQIYCIKLLLWRELFHFIGGVAAVILVYAIKRWLGVRRAIIFSVLFAAYILFQEFFLHPRAFDQIFFKSVFDSAVWLGPAIVYWALFAVGLIRSPKKRART